MLIAGSYAADKGEQFGKKVGEFIFDPVLDPEFYENTLRNRIDRLEMYGADPEKDPGVANLRKQLDKSRRRHGQCDFDRVKKYTPPRDPIILDLDGDGLETVGRFANIYFDHDGDGVLGKTGWVGKDDGLLVWDRNANGKVDTGAELFGDFTPLPDGSLAPNGFAALAVFDSNGDGVLDAVDPAFAELKLWKDNTPNGQTEAGELITLTEAGISALNLALSLKNQNIGNGNTLVRQGSFVHSDGSSGDMGEFHLTINTTASRFAEKITTPEENLPMVK